jgi:hypothetical protein
MRSCSTAFFALLLLAAAGSRAAGQQSGMQLETGARLRLTSPGLQSDRQIGRIVSLTSDSMMFRSERYPVSRSIARSDIREVEVSIGEKRRTGRGAVIGLLAGSVIGVVVGAQAGDEACVPTIVGCPEIMSTGEAAALFGAIGGAAGLLVGSTVGWLAKSERWKRVPFDARPTISPSRGGVAVSISRAF